MVFSGSAFVRDWNRGARGPGTGDLWSGKADSEYVCGKYNFGRVGIAFLCHARSADISDGTAVCLHGRDDGDADMQEQMTGRALCADGTHYHFKSLLKIGFH